MRSIAEVIPATREHIAYVAERMRQSDIDELAACGGTPHAALSLGLIASEECYAGLIYGETVCVFGVRLENWRWATPWLLGTDAIDKHRRIFMRESRSWFAEFAVKYGNLRNLVDARNTKSIAWLKWLGFEVGDPVPHGPRGMLFLPFHKESEQGCAML